MSIYHRVLRYYRPFLPKTIMGLLLSIVGIGLNLLKPWPFKIIVDDFLGPRQSPHLTEFVLFSGSHRLAIPGNLSGIFLLCLALVIIQFLWGVINWITNYLLVKVGLQALL